MRRSIFFLTIVLLLTACDLGGDGGATPTTAPSNTPDLTKIAELWTDTPTVTATHTATLTPTITPSITPTLTRTPTRTPRPTNLPSDTPTATDTPSDTPTDTDTPTNTPTVTPTDTPTDTRTPTNTPLPTETFTGTPAPTLTATRTPLPPLPSDTPRPLIPTRTPGVTATPKPTLTPTIAPTATRIPVTERASATSRPLIPSRTPGPSITPRPVTATSAPTRFVTRDVSATPTLPDPIENRIPTLGFPTPTFLPRPNTPLPGGGSTSGGGNNNGGGTLPAGSGNIAIIDPEGYVTTLDGERLGVGRTFDVGPQGQVAIQGFDNQLYVSGAMLTISPASEFGIGGDARIGFIDWSPAGGSVAFTYTNPQAEVDNGVWVYHAHNNTSQQIMRNAWDRTATRVSFSPDSSVVLIRLNTPGGPANAFLPTTWQANTDYRYHPYADATWAVSGTSIIVSGLETGTGRSVLGRVNLDQDQTFVPYDFSSSGMSYTAAATELSSGQLAFLAAPDADGPFRLYLMSVGGSATAISGEVNGQILSWEWNRSRTALLVLVDNAGTRQLWVINTSGGTQNVTPATGAPWIAKW